VLQEVRDQDPIEMVLRQLERANVADHGFHPRVLVQLVEVDHVDRPALRRRHRVDELAPPGRGVEDPLRHPEALREIRRDL
jgi:hypothetical protein